MDETILKDPPQRGNGNAALPGVYLSTLRSLPYVSVSVAYPAGQA
jgi:hypothetical protein